MGGGHAVHAVRHVPRLQGSAARRTAGPRKALLTPSAAHRPARQVACASVPTFRNPDCISSPPHVPQRATSLRPCRAAGEGDMSCHVERAVGLNSYEIQLRYDGTAYCGWQLQPGVRTIQSVLEKALETITGEPRSLLDVRAAGRTDAGVHARGQVVQFRSNKELHLANTCRSINGLVDHDIRAMAVDRTAPDWHVVFSATGKIYHYDIDTGRFHDPLSVRFRHHHPRALDVPAMQAAAGLLVGTHNFAQFSNLDPAGRVRNPVKTVWELDVQEHEGGLRLRVYGSGFLYKMVRHITGALLAVGVGRFTPADVANMLQVGSSVPPGAHGKNRGYNVAPAKGLMLVQVDYPPHSDHTQLMYHDLPHDQYGRAYFTAPSGGD